MGPVKVLVAGGTGFIGSHLAQRLAGEGHRVVVPVRKESRATRLGRGPWEAREADLLDPGTVALLMKGVDQVYHCASIRGSGWSLGDAEVARVNVGITRALLAAAAKEGVSRFVYISSVSVHGHPRGGPVEETSPCLPVTRYGRTKYESEMLVRDFHEKGRVPATVVRPVITYGPRDTWGMVPKLCALIRAKRYLTVGRGENRVHLIYVDDLVDGIVRAAGTPGTLGRTYILSGENPVTINRLVGIVSAALGVKVPSFHVPEAPARLAGLLMEAAWGALGAAREPFLTRDKIDIMCRDRFFSHERARKDFGFAPKTGYEEGLGLTVAWLTGGAMPATGGQPQERATP